MNFSELSSLLGGSSNHLEDEYFLDILHTQKDRELYSKIEVLDWQERVLGEIQGLATDGSVTVDMGSSVRRTCSLSLVVTESTINITDISGFIGLNRKIRVFVGLKNNVSGFEKYGDIAWFPMGIFVLTQGSIRHDVSTNSLNITAQDKMCLLNGEIGGSLTAPVDFAKYEQILENGDREEVYNVLYDIVRTSVIQFGGENPAKVLVMDVPNEVRKAMQLDGIGLNKSVWIDLKTGNSYDTKPSGSNMKLEELTAINNRLGYDMVPFTVPSKELMKQAGEPITSVLDDIAGILGNFEYFYDVEGNFVFREVRNYLNQAYKPYYVTSTGDYVANFSNREIFYSFVDKDISSSFSNNPDWTNIKNDFIVWGTKDIPGTDYKKPIMYRVAIDDLLFFQDTSPNAHPWQQQLLDYDDSLPAGLHKGPYYQDLKAKWSRPYSGDTPLATSEWVYDKKTREWNTDPSFYLDFIDINSDLGKFSVSNIGRRSKVVVDENVKSIYPQKSSDTRIVYQLDGESKAAFDKRVLDTYPPEYEIDIVKVYNNNETAVIKKQRVTGAIVLKDAFSVVRDLLFAHSTMNEVINISCIPLYNFDVNVKIEAEDIKSNISGYYMVRSVSIPLSIEGQMNISAIRANSRI